MPVIEHGTAKGARQHHAAGEQPCGPCAKAASRNRTDWRNARLGALNDLAAMYPTDFRALLIKHKVARGLRVKEVAKVATLTEAEKVRLRAKAWHAAAKRLISENRERFDALYQEEKTERGI